jgi:anti-sigma regulatory factor (Ser/Thr protein kinase)
LEVTAFEMIALPVVEQSQIAEARRVAIEYARRLQFDEVAQGRAAIVATELATNLIKHGRGGALLVSLPAALELASSQTLDQAELQMISIDRGPGFADFDRALRDGYSTAGSLGRGLGAIVRQSEEFNVYSRQGAGAAIMVRLRSEPNREGARIGAAAPSHLARIGAVCIAKPGEEVCGDEWAAGSSEPTAPREARTVMVVDGLGHGPNAAEASSAAVRIFNRLASQSPARIMEGLHAALRPTRGAAASIVQFDPARRVVTFCGLGNVAGVVASRQTGATKGMVTLNGTVGHVARRIRELEYPYPAEADPLVILHSDGLATHWSFQAYPGLSMAHPSLIAAVLYRDFARGRDDATVVAILGSGGVS